MYNQTVYKSTPDKPPACLPVILISDHDSSRINLWDLRLNFS